MGGDDAPVAEVRGAVQAAHEYGAQVILVGREEILRRELDKYRPLDDSIQILHAAEVVTMSDNPARALRSKKDSSIRAATEQVKLGNASGLVSAGNTGAVMATALKVLGRIPGVYRPAVAQIFPTTKEGRTLLLDVGANVNCTPDMLVQFAVMGSVYSKILLNCEQPRVGLLSIGEEEHKGNELTRDTTPLLKQQALNFIGNVEGQDLFSGKVDVIICDGFIGNVALKVSEGLVTTIKSMLIESFEATLVRQIGYNLVRGVFDDFRKRVDYAEYGGAPMLGVQGGVIICHGRSNSSAIKNAIRFAMKFEASGINQHIKENLHGSLGDHMHQPEASSQQLQQEETPPTLPHTLSQS